MSTDVIAPVVAGSPRPVTPLGILTAHLEAALRVANTLELPQDLSHNLHQALQLAAGLETYGSACTTPESPALAAIAQKTRAEPWQQRFAEGATRHPLEQEMLSGHVEGQVLKMFVHMTRAEHILDIGLFTGYSALAMAEALPRHGSLLACEVDPYVAGFAQKLLQQSGHGDKIQVELGPALTTLTRLATTQESFDLVFIDAAKQEYEQYFQALLDWNLLIPGGFICVDNTLFQGQVYLPEAQRSPHGTAIAQFNQVVQQDPRVEQVLLPIRDGLTLIRRLPA
jgi:caffeoyl-CoA O-methyltransferase